MHCTGWQQNKHTLYSMSRRATCAAGLEKGTFRDIVVQYEDGKKLMATHQLLWIFGGRSAFTMIIGTNNRYDRQLACTDTALIFDVKKLAQIRPAY